MSKVDIEIEAPAVSIRQKCVKCVQGRNLLRTLVVVICSVLVLQQITACVQKLINIPITTYTHFDFNETLMYPSITFCRDPPYKFDKMEEYGLYSHPRFTSVWRNFNFSQTTLDELWEDITYTEDEFFVQYGLDGLEEKQSQTAEFMYIEAFLSNAKECYSLPDVAVTSRLGFVQGKCHTLTPKILSNKASRGTGYSLTLRHSFKDIANTISTNPPGYNVYVHYTKEPFTEVAVYNGGLIDYLYVNTGETIDVKLTVDQYEKISQDGDPCVSWENYSANECTTDFVSSLAGEEAGCSGPWMTSNLPRCDNYEDMRKLITAYVNIYEDHNCSICPRICRAYLYNAFVTFRRSDYTWDAAQKVWALNFGDAMLETHLYLHFNTMMVSVYEERHNYDFNLFLSDLGGSIGFLLGLSVISLITIFGKAWSTMILPFFRPRVGGSSTASAADIQTVSKDLAQDLGYMTKCKEWIKNDMHLLK